MSENITAESNPETRQNPLDRGNSRGKEACRRELKKNEIRRRKE
jgi:hypothetical protein